MKDMESGYRFYRFLLLGICALVPVAALYGRYLERTYPWLIIAIPSSGFLIFFLHATSLAQKTVRTEVSPEKQRLKNLIATAAVSMPVLALCISAQLVDLSIERIHIVKYGLLTFLVVFAQSGPNLRRRLLIAFLAGSLIGVGEETAQLWIPLRRFDPRDVLLNIVSAALGTAYASICILAAKLRGANY